MKHTQRIEKFNNELQAKIQNFHLKTFKDFIQRTLKPSISLIIAVEKLNGNKEALT